MTNGDKLVPLKDATAGGNGKARLTRIHLDIIDPLTLHGRAVPERDWVVPGWIPSGHVTMLAGDGGTGKTLLAMQLMTAAATGVTWLGSAVKRCKTLGVFCEDDADELHRRQADINRHFGIDFADLEDMRWMSRVGVESSLVNFHGPGEWGSPSDFYGRIMDLALSIGAQLVVLDSLHDLFDGDENRRPEARRFIAHLRTLAIEAEAAVVLTSHPSRSGRGDGSGESGSTAWNNAVRSRIYLTRDDGDDHDARALKRMKANYSSINDRIRVAWRDGVFVAESSETTLMAGLRQRNAETVFLDMLDQMEREGRSVSDSSRAGNYAPRIFAGRPGRQGLKVEDFRRAMENLFAAGKVRVGEHGRSGHRRKRIERAESTLL